MSGQLNLNRFAVYQNSTKHLHKRKVRAEMALENLTIEENRNNVRLDLLGRIASDENLFSRVITDDEPWIFEYDP